MENIMQIADTVMEYVVQPAQRTTRPAAWVRILHRGIQILKVALLCCQALAWIGVL